MATVKPNEKTTCDCPTCQAACRHVPGWFTPGEAAKAAKLKKMPLRAFFKKYLAVNYFYGDERDPETVFALAPATVTMQPGGMYPIDPRGACVFLEDGRCGIYAARPSECARGNPCDSMPSEKKHEHRRRYIIKPWRTKAAQAEIVALLGHEPEPPETGFLDFLSLLMPSPFRGEG